MTHDAESTTAISVMSVVDTAAYFRRIRRRRGTLPDASCGVVVDRGPCSAFESFFVFRAQRVDLVTPGRPGVRIGSSQRDAECRESSSTDRERKFAECKAEYEVTGEAHMRVTAKHRTSKVEGPRIAGFGLMMVGVIGARPLGRGRRRRRIEHARRDSRAPHVRHGLQDRRADGAGPPVGRERRLRMEQHHHHRQAHCGCSSTTTQYDDDDDCRRTPRRRDDGRGLRRTL